MAFGGTVKLTGESEYKKALADITGNLKVLNSEMKVVTSQYDSNDKSAENLTQQNNVLNKKIDEQKDKVSILKKALAEAEEETGKNSSTSQKWQTELNNAQAELNKLENTVSKNKKTMEQSDDATEKNADSVEKFGKEADDSGKKALSMGDIIKANLISEGIMSGLSALGGAIAGIGEKFGAFLALGEETKETQTQWAKLGTSFESAGLDMDFATDSMYALTGVLGDAGKATEASVLLSKMSKDGKDLEANTRILTGVFAEFGDSIPTEGLAEGMNATAEMGSVQGVLADALEWQGVNLEEYNAKLESMTTAEERASYIQSTLTDLYGKSADAYRENNQALIESNEAQLRYETHLAEMGKLAVPLQTNIKNISSSLMRNFTPALEGVMPDINALTGSFGELIEAVLGGDEGGIEFAMLAISENIMFLVENLKNVLPQVMETVMALISTLVTVIADNLPYLAESGISMLMSLMSGIGDNLLLMLPTVIAVIQTLLTTILDSLPMIIEMGTTMLTSLIQGIIPMLPKIIETGFKMVASLLGGIKDTIPTLIPIIIDAVLLMVDTIIDNIDWIIDAGIEVIFALSDGLLKALPDLIDKMPVIIDKLVVALTDNLDKLLEMGVTLILELGGGLIKAIPQLVSKVPQIITSLVDGFKKAWSDISDVGVDLVKGIWDGMSSSMQWIKDKIKGWVGNVTNFLKELFGIHSPSRLFKDEIGTNLALGIGEGFGDTMHDVSEDMASAIPTEFDADISTNVNTGAGYSHNSNYDMMVSAFKQALTEVKVVMNNREMGAFVTNTIERVVFA